MKLKLLDCILLVRSLIHLVILSLGGLLKISENHPTNRPKASVRASILLEVVIIFKTLNILNNIAVACHLIRALSVGLGYLTRHTYQPFRITILPY